MKRKHSQCCIAFAKRKQQSSVLVLEVIDDHEWRALAKACESVKDGEERFFVKSVGKCPKYRTVCNIVVVHVQQARL